jgi:hypothetical protein
MRALWKVELLAWLIVLILCLLVLGPVYLRTGIHYQFYIENGISMLVFLTFTRLLFLLSFTPYARNKAFKFVFIFLPIPLIMFLVDNLYDFQRFLDEEGTIAFFKGGFEMSDYNFGKFIKYQYLFFTTGAIVASLLMPVRMIVSFWRLYNTENKV